MFGRKKEDLNDEWGALDEEPKIQKNNHPTRHLRLEDIDPKKAEEERQKQEELKRQEQQIKEIRMQKELAPKKPEPLDDPDTNVLFQLDTMRKTEEENETHSNGLFRNKREKSSQNHTSRISKSERNKLSALKREKKTEKESVTTKKGKQPKQRQSKKSSKEKRLKEKTRLTRGQQMAMDQLEDVEDYGIDPGRMIELPEWDLPVWAKKVGIVAIIAFIVVGLGILGYVESDFNTAGQPEIVSLEMRSERMYVKQSDKLLQEMIDDAAYIQDHTADMSSDYINISTKLQQQKNQLNADTTKLSKYVDVPESMEAYHTKLINVSLGIQKLQTDIINNYQASDYDEWRASNVSSMNDSMETLHKMRFQIDERIWKDAQ